MWTGALIPFFSIRLLIGLETDTDETAGTVFNASLPFLKADECERVKGNLFDIALDMKEERKQRQSRGFHCKFYFEIMCFLDLYITMLLQWNRVTAL